MNLLFKMVKLELLNLIDMLLTGDTINVISI